MEKNKKKGISFFQGRKHSEETKKKMSEMKKGSNHPFYGKKFSHESIEKIKLARAKQIISPESNKKRSETLKGRTFSPESIEKMRQHALKRFADKRNSPHYGKTPSEETRKKISEALKGRSYEELHGIQKALKLKKIIKKNRAKQIFPLKDSSIENKIRKMLEYLELDFFQHKYMNIQHGYQCDFFIPSKNLVIETDGIYWHNYPTGRPIDRIRTEELIQKGFKVLRLWEFEIQDLTIDELKKRIQVEISK